MRHQRSKGNWPQVPEGEGPWTLTSHRLSGDVVEIELDYRHVLQVDAEVFYRHNWGEGYQLDRADLEELMGEHQVKWCKDRVIRLLSYRSRTESEVRRYLQRFGVGQSVINEVVAWLKDQSLINDREFIVHWVENRMATNPMGYHRLVAELVARGIDRLLVEQTLQELKPQLDEKTTALRLASSRVHRYRRDDPVARQRKLAAYLQRRGFSLDVIREVLKTVLSQELDGPLG